MPQLGVIAWEREGSGSPARMASQGQQKRSEAAEEVGGLWRLGVLTANCGSERLNVLFRIA